MNLGGPTSPGIQSQIIRPGHGQTTGHWSNRPKKYRHPDPYERTRSLPLSSRHEFYEHDDKLIVDYLVRYKLHKDCSLHSQTWKRMHSVFKWSIPFSVILRFFTFYFWIFNRTLTSSLRRVILQPAWPLAIETSSGQTCSIICQIMRLLNSWKYPTARCVLQGILSTWGVMAMVLLKESRQGNVCLQITHCLRAQCATKSNCLPTTPRPLVPKHLIPLFLDPFPSPWSSLWIPLTSPFHFHTYHFSYFHFSWTSKTQWVKSRYALSYTFPLMNLSSYAPLVLDLVKVNQGSVICLTRFNVYN